MAMNFTCLYISVWKI